MDISTKLTIIGLVTSFVIPIAGYIIKEFMNAAKIIVKFDGGLTHTTSGQFVNPIPTEDDYDMVLSVRRFFRTWRGTLVLQNVGNKPASDIQFYFHNESPIISIADKPKKYDHLEPMKSISLKTTYKLSFDMAPKDRSAFVKKSQVTAIFKDFKLLIKYKTSFGIYRYTIFSFDTKENKHKYMPPHRYISLNNGKPPEGYNR